jgi:hypothetical protein
MNFNARGFGEFQMFLVNYDPDQTGKAAALFKAHDIARVSAGIEPSKSRNTTMT